MCKCSLLKNGHLNHLQLCSTIISSAQLYSITIYYNKRCATIISACMLRWTLSHLPLIPSSFTGVLSVGSICNKNWINCCHWSAHHPRMILMPAPCLKYEFNIFFSKIVFRSHPCSSHNWCQTNVPCYVPTSLAVILTDIFKRVNSHVHCLWGPLQCCFDTWNSYYLTKMLKTYCVNINLIN